MTQPTRIYKHSSAGTDWAALALGAGLGLTLALQLTTVRLSDFNTFYSVIVSISRLLAAQSANIKGVSGASYTSYGWFTSLQGAMAQAGL